MSHLRLLKDQYYNIFHNIIQHIEHLPCTNYFDCISDSQDDIHKYLLPNNIIHYDNYRLQYCLQPIDKSNDIVLVKGIGKIIHSPSFFSSPSKVDKYLAMYRHIHDINISLWLNKLLVPYIPNLVTLYGVKEASTTTLTYVNNEYTIALYSHSKNNAQLYAYQDYINAPTLTDYIINNYGTVFHFLNIMYQVVGTLCMAHEVCKFSHHDLTSTNILVKQNHNQQICYNTCDIYLTSDVLAYIINFDKASLTIDNNTLSSILATTTSYDCLQDIYTLLMHIAQLILDLPTITIQQRKILTVVDYLLKYFTHSNDYTFSAFFHYMNKKYQHNNKKCGIIIPNYIHRYNYTFNLDDTYNYYDQQLQHINYPTTLTVTDHNFLRNCNLYYQIIQLQYGLLTYKIQCIITNMIEKQQLLLNSLPFNYSTSQLIHAIIKIYTYCNIKTSFKY